MAALSALAWISLACLLLAAGVGLWGYAQQKQKISSISERVQRVLDAEPIVQLPFAIEKQKKQLNHSWLRFVPEWLQQAFTFKQWCFIGGGTLLATAFIALLSNLFIALLVPMMVLCVVTFLAWMRWQKLRARIVQQLPSFIDGMIRMVVLGHATQSAFVMAANSAKAPLAQTVSQAAAFTKAGMPMEQALQVVNRDLKIQELSLLASVVQVGGRFGGRVDGLLERVANLIRDREQADRELRALSAEVRVSAWILSLLPILVGGAIVVLNASYFMKLWDDPSGRWIGFTGLGLQVIGTIILYRLAKLDD